MRLIERLTEFRRDLNSGRTTLYLANSLQARVIV
eukprot:08804.XXX_32346_32447_1 [CDS] Oithona nana genome sequencing.